MLIKRLALVVPLQCSWKSWRVVASVVNSRSTNLGGVAVYEMIQIATGSGPECKYGAE